MIIMAAYSTIEMWNFVINAVADLEVICSLIFVVYEYLDWMGFIHFFR